MKTSVKAALLSALVLPGLGQMYLKRYARGLIPMLLVLAGVGILIARAAAVALEVLEKMQMQGGTADMKAVSDLAAASSPQGNGCSTLIWLVIASGWLFGVIDAYRLGKDKDSLNEQSRATAG